MKPLLVRVVERRESSVRCRVRPQASPSNDRADLLTALRTARYGLSEKRSCCRRIASPTWSGGAPTDQAEVESAWLDPDDGSIAIPVMLKAHDSLLVPLAKWP